MSDSVQIEASWKEVLAGEFSQQYFADIKQFILEQRQKGKRIYPAGSLIFNAFNLSGQAHGLSFSVPHGVKPPPSLVNIYKELKNDLNIDPPAHGNLEAWAKQGVLLLNAFLTVNESEAGSHQKAGWDNFTNAVIKTISDKKEHVVFILWGNFAQQKQVLIDQSKHLVMKSAHPSPLSAHAGFFGSKPFSKANAYLKEHNEREIDWRL
jgi:uracil-DNA glycosylase